MLGTLSACAGSGGGGGGTGGAPCDAPCGGGACGGDHRTEQERHRIRKRQRGRAFGFYMERRDSLSLWGGYRLDRQVGHLSSPEARQEARAVVSNRWKQGVMVVWAGSVRSSMVMGQAVPRAMASRITAA